jgi:hypothetical protein
MKIDPLLLNDGNMEIRSLNNIYTGLVQKHFLVRVQYRNIEVNRHCS